jgi:hypothetical protein
MARGKLTIIVDPESGRTQYDLDHPTSECGADADALEVILALLGCDEPGDGSRRARRPRQAETAPLPQKNRQGHGD